VDVSGSASLSDLWGNLGDVVTASLREELAALQQDVAAAQQRCDEEAGRREEAAAAAREEADRLREEVEKLSAALARARASVGELKVANAALVERCAAAEAKAEKSAGEAAAAETRVREAIAQAGEASAAAERWREQAAAQAEALKQAGESQAEALARAERAEAELERELEKLMSEVEASVERDADRQREADDLLSLERRRGAEALQAAEATTEAWRGCALAADARCASLAMDLTALRRASAAVPSRPLPAAAPGGPARSSLDAQARRPRHSCTPTCRAPSSDDEGAESFDAFHAAAHIDERSSTVAVC